MSKMNFLAKTMVLAALVFASFGLSAQGRIELAPAKSTIPTEMSLSGFRMTLNYDAIESQSISTEKGNFSAISIDDTYVTGHDGQAQLPSTHKLVASPVGSTPVVTVHGYSESEYQLDEYGIGRLYPRQPSVRKDTKPEDIHFIYDEEYYASEGYDRNELVTCEIMGCVRGVQIVSVQINPVRYNPATNSIKVFNDIDLEVKFENGDVEAMKENIVKTYSPYFDVVYKQLFNGKAIMSVYDEHPDLYKTPVKMLVVANDKYKDVMTPWLEWKTKKGFYITEGYTSQIGSSTEQIKTWIRSQYSAGVASGVAPTFLVIFGDKADVPESAVGSYTEKVTDLYYSSVDDDLFPDIYTSRMSAETSAQMSQIIEKILMYEQYAMPDDSYLNNALLIAGADGTWNPFVAQPTIKYATTYYFNTAHGYSNVYSYLTNYTNCYSSLNTGVGFANYTAHGFETGWYDPSLTTNDIDNLTNTNKYFLAMGNCCLAGNWGWNGGTCFGESIIRANKKGAFTYIGSCPETFWFEDLYFAAGAQDGCDGQTPTYEGTSTGFYDGYWLDAEYNSISSLMFLGNISVTYAHDQGYQPHSTTPYYWQAYHVLGDGSVMPYRLAAEENTVAHLDIVPLQTNHFEVSADPYSYVAMTNNGEIIGTAYIDESGFVDMDITPVTEISNIDLVITCPQKKPYMVTLPTASLDGAYLAVSGHTPSPFVIGQETDITLTMKNVGTAATTGTTTVTVTSSSNNLVVVNGQQTIGALTPGQTAETAPFSFIINENVSDNTKFDLNVTSTCGNKTWTNVVSITAGKAVFEDMDYIWAGSFEAGETLPLQVTFVNNGHYAGQNVKMTLSTTSQYATIAEPTQEIGSVDVGGFASGIFNITIADNCPVSQDIVFTAHITADGNVSAQDNLTLHNGCIIVFTLNDSWGDGWSGAKLKLSFDNGAPDQYLTNVGSHQEVYEVEMVTGTTCSLYWISGQYDYECTFTIAYKDGDVIYTSSGTPTEGFMTSFVIDCAGSTLKPGVENLSYSVFNYDVTLTWSAPARDDVSYRITRNGVIVGETENLTYTDVVDAIGSYIYGVTAVYPDGVSLPVTITIIVTSVDENDAATVRIYPNPVNERLNIVVSGSFQYQILDIAGRVIANGDAVDEVVLDLSGYDGGLYLVKTISDNGMTVKRIIKK